MTVQRVSLPPLPTRRSVPYSSFIIITFVAYLCHRHYDTICRYLYIPPGPPPPIELYHKYHHHGTSNEPTTPKTEEPLSHDTSSSSSSSFSSEHSHSPNTSWNEYIHEHTYQLLHSLIALGIQTPYYIITNAFHSLMVDVQDYFHRQRPFQWTITTSIQQFITTVVPHSILRIHNNHTTSQDTPLLHTEYYTIVNGSFHLNSTRRPIMMNGITIRWLDRTWRSITYEMPCRPGFKLPLR